MEQQNTTSTSPLLPPTLREGEGDTGNVSEKEYEQALDAEVFGHPRNRLNWCFRLRVDKALSGRNRKSDKVRQHELKLLY